MPPSVISPLLIRDLDDGDRRLQFGESVSRQGGEFVVGDQQFGGAMLQDEGDRAGIQAVIQRVQHRPGHRHAVMRFEQCRHVRREDRDRVARRRSRAAAARRQSGGSARRIRGR